jgi:hypothetical protein
MPWFPDFTSAVELARRQTRAAGQADPVGQYFTALSKGDTHALETVWPGEVVIHDPRAGEIRGHQQLRRFVRINPGWPGGTPVSRRGLHRRRRLLATARIDDDVEAPAELQRSGTELSAARRGADPSSGPKHSA